VQIDVVGPVHAVRAAGVPVVASGAGRSAVQRVPDDRLGADRDVRVVGRGGELVTADLDHEGRQWLVVGHGGQIPCPG